LTPFFGAMVVTLEYVVTILGLSSNVFIVGL